VRYINYFSFNVFEVSNFAINLLETSLTKGNVLLRIEFPDDNLVTVLQIMNGGKLQVGTEEKKGSILDLDTFIVEPSLGENKSIDFRHLIDLAHQELKRRFFSGLKDEYINSLNPQYE